LVFGQLVGTDQISGEGFAVFRSLSGRAGILKRRDLGGGHQPALGQVLNELFERDSHRLVSGTPE
jgi:hypothetical protein